jgi:hypothetical protein
VVAAEEQEDLEALAMRTVPPAEKAEEEGLGWLLARVLIVAW